MQNVLYAILVLGCMGAVFGLVLAIASKVFAVKTDERLEPLIEALPGANCGGCGFSGCAAYAQAVLEGKARIGKCAAGGKSCADTMAKIMGQEPVEMERMVAMVTCHGVDAIPKGNYEGLRDCISASRVAGKGPMLCEYGCLGFGNCVKVCPTGAIRITETASERTIWGKTFSLVTCESCGRVIGTKEEIAYAAKRAGREPDTLCDSCRKKQIALGFKAIYGE